MVLGRSGFLEWSSDSDGLCVHRACEVPRALVRLRPYRADGPRGFRTGFCVTIQLHNLDHFRNGV